MREQSIADQFKKFEKSSFGSVSLNPGDELIVNTINDYYNRMLSIYIQDKTLTGDKRKDKYLIYNKMLLSRLGAAKKQSKGSKCYSNIFVLQKLEKGKANIEPEVENIFATVMGIEPFIERKNTESSSRKYIKAQNEPVYLVGLRYSQRLKGISITNSKIKDEDEENIKYEDNFVKLFSFISEFYKNTKHKEIMLIHRQDDYELFNALKPITELFGVFSDTAFKDMYGKYAESVGERPAFLKISNELVNRNHANKLFKLI